MVISSSAIGMAAKTTKSVKYSQTNESLASAVGTGEKRYASNTFNAEYERTVETSLYEETAIGKRHCEEKTNKDVIKEDNTDVLANNGFINQIESEEEITLQSLLRQIRSFLIDFRHRLSMMIGANSPYTKNYIDGLSSGNSLGGTVIDLTSGSGANGYNVWNVTNYSKASYEETETMAFSTVGKAITADGRAIEFNMEIDSI